MKRKLTLVITPLFLLLVFALPGCKKNQPPVIIGITLVDQVTSAGKIHTFKVDAYDEEDAILQYEWSANAGEFVSSTTGKQVEWKSPVDGEGHEFSIQVRVSDGELAASAEYEISLSEAILGGVSGYVYYSKYDLIIEQTTIKIGGKETTTDQDGYFQIDDIVSGKDTLYAFKEDFSPVSLVINIPENGVLKTRMEMLSVVHTTKVFGKVLDQNNEPIGGVLAMILNPDGSESLLTAKSDGAGVYRIPYVPHGSRTLILSKEISNDNRYTTIREKIELKELEQRFDYTMEKIALSGFYTDPRDNFIYPYRTIGEQTWMTMNMTWLPEVYPSSEVSDYDPRYYVYGYEGSDTAAAKSQDFYEMLGVLYNFDAAVKACPPGWHLPSQEEWLTLRNTLYPAPGYKMKSTSGWADEGNGDNSSGFSGLPGGNLNKEGEFRRYGAEAFFYSSNWDSYQSAVGFRLHYWSSYLYEVEDSQRLGYSVRCIRDE